MGYSHYSYAQDVKCLADFAKKLVEAYLHHKDKWHCDTPLLAYSGLSGITLATMIAYEMENNNIEYGLIYVRKKGEQTHGHPLEISIDDGKNYTMFFIDDFIDDGDTYKYVKSNVFQFFDKLHLPLDHKNIYVMLSGSLGAAYPECKISKDDLNDRFIDLVII